MQVIVVDTTWLAPSENKATNEEGGISVETQASSIERQLLDLEAIFNETLTDRPTWLIVAGHYPIFSRGEKGDNEELDIFLRPLLEHFNVHAYLSGHDHNRQWINAVPLTPNLPEGIGTVPCNTHFAVSGAGAKTTDLVGRGNVTDFEDDRDEGFLFMSFYPDRVEVEFCDADGNTEWSKTIRKP